MVFLMSDDFDKADSTEPTPGAYTKTPGKWGIKHDPDAPTVCLSEDPEDLKR